uniref:BESS domain-containing protein n=1 Tax=Timema tahoe TaxID=61484 RepID=A0A7R9NXP2_9NEOP|nr:unnamed protein product [Timema tahoe]
MSRYKDEPSYNIKFVQEVEKYPCVYNYKLPEYSRKDITAHAWQKIAKEMKDTGPPLADMGPPLTCLTSTPEPPLTCLTSPPEPPLTCLTSTPEPPLTCLTSTPEPPLTCLTSTPEPPLTCLTSTPEPPLTCLTSTPEPPLTCLTSTPEPPLTCLTSTPEPPLTCLTSTPEPPLTCLTSTPEPPLTCLTSTPEPPLTCLTSTPEPPLTCLTSTPEPPLTCLTSTPEPPLTCLTSTPEPPLTCLTSTPEPPLTCLTSTPEPPLTCLTSTPEPPLTCLTSTPEPPLTLAGCKERWKNLRTVFVRKLKPALGGSTRRGKRAYYLKESMRFLLPHLKVVHNTHNPEHFLSPIKADNSGDVEEEFESDPLNIPVDDEDELPGASGLQQYYDPPPPEDCPHGLVGRMSAASCADERENCPNLTDSRSFIEFLNLEKGRTTCDDDPRKQFLLSLLPDIKQMTDVQMRRFKIKVLNLVEDILSEVPIGSTRD